MRAKVRRVVLMGLLLLAVWMVTEIAGGTLGFPMILGMLLLWGGMSLPILGFATIFDVMVHVPIGGSGAVMAAGLLLFWEWRRRHYGMIYFILLYELGWIAYLAWVGRGMGVVDLGMLAISGGILAVRFRRRLW